MGQEHEGQLCGRRLAAPDPAGVVQTIDTAGALVRIGLASLSGILLLLGSQTVDSLVAGGVPAWWGTVLALAVVASLVQVLLSGRARTSMLVAESVIVGLAIGAAPAEAWPLQLYLLAPAMLAGIALPWRQAALLSALSPTLAAGVSTATPLGTPWMPWQSLSWIVLGLLSASGAALLRRHRTDTDGTAEAYAIAVGLLRQLDRLSRRMPAGLDSGTVASAALGKVVKAYPGDQICLVLHPATGDRFSGMFVGNSEAVASLPPGLWEQTLQSRTPAVVRSSSEPVDTWTALIPLLAQGKVEAMAAVTRRHGRLHRSDARKVEQLLQGVGLQLAASALFSDVRETAVAEERHRLSASIHDGIAQDLAGLAYSLDAIAMTGSDPDQVREVSGAAAEVRRLVDELRLSIFDLRTDVGIGERLGTALAAYSRQVAERSGMRIHVDIDDAAAHVHPDAGHELMRIAQEAITNSRKHSRANTLWVQLRITTCGVTLTVADDGLGVENRAMIGHGSGMYIMRERAARLGGTVTIDNRQDGGTEVIVQVGERCVSPWPLNLSGPGAEPINNLGESDPASKSLAGAHA